MLQGLIVLVALQLAGEAISHYFSIPIPGAIIGMVMLLVFLMLKGGVSPSLSDTAQKLFPYLPLLLIPASVGVVQYGELLEKEGIAVVSALVLSVVLSFLLVPFLFKALKAAFGK